MTIIFYAIIRMYENYCNYVENDNYEFYCHIKL